MKEIYSSLTQYEKQITWKTRFGAIYRIFLSKLWHGMIKDGKSWIFNSLMILPIIAGPIIALLSRGSLTAVAYYALYSDIMFLGYFGLIIPLFTMYIGSMLFNDEIQDKTLTYFTIRPINRFELVVVKYLAYLTIVPIFTALTTGLFYFSFAIFGRFQYFSAMLWYFLAAVIASVVYGAIFMLVGLLFKRPLWFGLFFVFIWEFVFASFSQTLNSLTIAFYIKSLICTDLYPNQAFNDSPSFITLTAGTEAQNYTLQNTIASPLTYCIVFAVLIIVSLTLSWAKLQGDKFQIPYGAGKRPGGWKYYLKEIRSYLITFGIVFITLGLTIGPVSGQRKIVRQTVETEISIRSTLFWSSDDFTPTISDMGYGDYVSYSLSKGDTLDATFDIFSDYMSSVEYYGMFLETEDLEDFISTTQDLWLNYYNNIKEDPFIYGEFFFPSLMNDYFEEVNILAGKAIDTISISNTTIDTTLEYSTPQNQEINVALFVKEFNATQYSNIYDYVIIDITADTFRKGGYVFGWTVFGLGIISAGFSIYSLITYDSAIEIQRYEDKREKYQEVMEENYKDIDNLNSK